MLFSTRFQLNLQLIYIKNGVGLALIIINLYNLAFGNRKNYKAVEANFLQKIL